MSKYDRDLYNHHNNNNKKSRSSSNLKKRSLCQVRIHNTILIYNKIMKRGENNDYLLLDHNHLQATSQCCSHLS